MIKSTHQVAYDLAKKIHTKLSGQDLIKEAFAQLYRVPSNRLIFRPGNITEDQFLRGQYIHLNQAGRSVIQPLPIGEDPAIPVVLTREDIPAAFQALETSLSKKCDTLHDHALACSAKELVAHYRADPQQEIRRLLSKLSYTTSRTGYTGQPFSPANALCAQLAWLAVGSSVLNPSEEFWKLLYPRVTGTLFASGDHQWPSYGEALLDKNLALGQEGQLINYRLVYEEAKFSQIKVLDRVKTFHSDHVGFWADGQKGSKPSEFKNYYDFFMALKEFSLANSATHLGAAFETEIGAQRQDEFLTRFAYGLQRFLNWYKGLDRVIKRNAEVILSKQYASSLPEICDDLLSTNQNQRCLYRNGGNLKSVLDGNSDIKNYLQKLPFDWVPLDESLSGVDELDYLEVHCDTLTTLSIDGLIHELKHGKNVPITAMANRFMTLLPQHLKSRYLLNFICYINEVTVETSLIHALNSLGFFPKHFTREASEFQYVLRIYDRLGMAQERITLLKEIHDNVRDLNASLSGVTPSQFVRDLINASQRDMQTMILLRKIESADTAPIKVHLYINACRNNPNEINAALNYFSNTEGVAYKNLDDLIQFFERLSDPKQRIAFDYYKQDFIEMHQAPTALRFSMHRLREISDLLYEALKKKHTLLVKDKTELARSLLQFSYAQRVDFCEIYFQTQEQAPLFSSVKELNQWFNDYFDSSLHICIALKPLLLSLVKDLDDFHTLYQGLGDSDLLDLSEIFHNQLSGWIDPKNKPKFYYEIFPKQRDEILNELLSSGLAVNPGEDDLLSCKMIHWFDFTKLSVDQKNAVLARVNLRIDSAHDLCGLLRQVKTHPQPKIIIDYFEDKIKSLINREKAISLCKELPLREIALLFEKFDPSLFDMINVDEYHYYYPYKDSEKGKFLMEKLQPFFNNSLERTLEIYRLVNGQECTDDRLKEGEDSVAWCMRTTLHDYWKLASIKDKDERIRKTYAAALRERGPSSSRENEQESPRLKAVRLAFNSK